MPKSSLGSESAYAPSTQNTIWRCTTITKTTLCFWEPVISDLISQATIALVSIGCDQTHVLSMGFAMTPSYGLEVPWIRLKRPVNTLLLDLTCWNIHALAQLTKTCGILRRERCGARTPGQFLIFVKTEDYWLNFVITLYLSIKSIIRWTEVYCCIFFVCFFLLNYFAILSL